MSCLSDGCVAPNGVRAHPIQWVVVGAHVTGVRVHVAPVWKTVTRRSSTFRRTALRGGRLPNWPTRIGITRRSTRSSSRNGRPRAARSRSAATCSGRPLPPHPVEKSGAPGPCSPGREAGRRRRNAVRIRNRSWSRRLNGHPRFPSRGASRMCERLDAGPCTCPAVAGRAGAGARVVVHTAEGHVLLRVPHGLRRRSVRPCGAGRPCGTRRTAGAGTTGGTGGARRNTP